MTTKDHLTLLQGGGPSDYEKAEIILRTPINITAWIYIIRAFFFGGSKQRAFNFFIFTGVWELYVTEAMTKLREQQ